MKYGPGTGRSSTGYLRRADFDRLKTDRSFVQSISAENPESTAIIRAVVALAGSLGMKTVAAGVTTAEQLALVRALGRARSRATSSSGRSPGPRFARCSPKTARSPLEM